MGRCDEARRTASQKASSEFGIDLSLGSWGNRASSAVALWPTAERTYAWDWDEIHRRYRTDPDRFDLCMWVGDILCGVALATLSGPAATINFLEGQPSDDCPLKGVRAAIAIEAVLWRNRHKPPDCRITTCVPRWSRERVVRAAWMGMALGLLLGVQAVQAMPSMGLGGVIAPFSEYECDTTWICHHSNFRASHFAEDIFVDNFSRNPNTCISSNGKSLYSWWQLEPIDLDFRARSRHERRFTLLRDICIGYDIRRYSDGGNGCHQVSHLVERGRGSAISYRYNKTNESCNGEASKVSSLYTNICSDLSFRCIFNTPYCSGGNVSRVYGSPGSEASAPVRREQEVDLEKRSSSENEGKKSQDSGEIGRWIVRQPFPEGFFGFLLFTALSGFALTLGWVGWWITREGETHYED